MGNAVVHLFICLLAILISFFFFFEKPFFFFFGCSGSLLLHVGFSGCSEWCCSLAAVLGLLTAVASLGLEYEL